MSGPRRGRPPATGSPQSSGIALDARGDSMLDEQEWSLLEDFDAPISPEDLREFLSGDLYGSQADPAFKEQLREKLWALVRDRYGAREND